MNALKKKGVASKKSQEWTAGETAAVREASKSGYLTLLGGMDRKLFGRWFTGCRLDKRACVYAVVGTEVARVELDMLTAEYRLRADALAIVSELFVKLGNFSALKQGQSPGNIGPRICLNRRVKLDNVRELCLGLVELAAKECREQAAEAEEKARLKTKLAEPDAEEKTPSGLYLPHKRRPGLTSLPPWQKIPEPPKRPE